MMILRTRKEQYLNEIVGGGNTAPETPQTREELFYAAILGEVVAPSPITRAEKYLAKIANKYSGEMPEPKTRIEKFIARAAGMDVTIPTPITREEMLWANYALIVEKELSGIPPLTFKAKKAGTLKNYRIYGNTVNGESVGDKTENLIQGVITGVNISSNGKISGLSDYNVVYAPVVAEESYTISNNNGVNVYAFYAEVPTTKTPSSYNGSRQVFNSDSVTFTAPITGYAAVRTASTAQDIMINFGSEALPYEPYGYRVPVTVTNGTGTETTNLYLPEQIKTVGTETEYIDFKKQKQHFANGTSVDVSLPALPTLSGTNTLSVGTEVQPSNVYIKYEGAR